MTFLGFGCNKTSKKHAGNVGNMLIQQKANHIETDAETLTGKIQFRC